ncbi:hypothetical protein BU021_08475 [Staphylococcus simulans]|uniref:hypothetical protein n=1 Tax=Staphylococcus simulans TaxID=1286 RepID=UPI000D1E1D92|nr:hypothetical protein [Staphylococcus simulans]PTJ39804.1 hypothetical protein BU021_08475 [Staphylococcus simulans]
MSIIGVVLTIVGTVLTVFNTISAIKWRKRNYDYQREMDNYKNELQEENYAYIKELNDKNELKEFINNFIKLGYSTTMSCVAFLYTLDYIVNNLTKNNEYIENAKLERLLREYFDIKKDVNVLKTDTTHLYLHSSDKNEAALIGGTFNEIYFLSEFIEIQLMKHYNKEKINNRKMGNDIKKALSSTEDVLKIMSKLDSMLVNKINIQYSDKAGDGTMTFVTGTEYFKWYFPEFPDEVKTLNIKGFFT